MIMPESFCSAFAVDLDRPKVPTSRIKRQRGPAPVQMNATATAAHAQAVVRAKSGFEVIQMTSEYRVLRAIVFAALGGGRLYQETVDFAAALQEAGRFILELSL